MWGNGGARKHTKARRGPTGLESPITINESVGVTANNPPTYSVLVVVLVRSPCVGAVVRRIAIAVVRLMAIDERRAMTPANIRPGGCDGCRDGDDGRHGESGCALPHSQGHQRQCITPQAIGYGRYGTVTVRYVLRRDFVVTEIRYGTGFYKNPVYRILRIHPLTGDRRQSIGGARNRGPAL